MNVAGIPVRTDTLYTNHKGQEKAGLRKRADKALERLADVLRKVLEPEEAVLYVTPAQSPLTTFHQLTLGWMSYYITKSMLVVTNKRVLAFSLKPKSFGSWEWNRRIRSIRFGDVMETAVKGVVAKTINLTYATGGKERYWGIPSGDAKKLKLIVDAIMPARAGEASPARGPVSLCPTCMATLVSGQEHCRQCNQQFATVREMWKRSILVPGGGYFYAGQAWLGLADAFAETVLLGVTVYALLLAFGAPEPVGDLEPYMGSVQALILAGFFGVLLVIEKLMTGYHCKHFVADFYALSKPPSNGKWFFFSAASYGAVLALVFMAIPWNERPILEIAPDVKIYQAKFGVFERTSTDQVVFTATDVVPYRPGLQYGFLLRLRTPRPNVKLGTQFEIPGASIDPGNVPEGLQLHEENAETEEGVIVRVWRVDPQEPELAQVLKVTLDGQPVQAFPFRVTGPRETQALLPQ